MNSYNLVINSSWILLVFLILAGFGLAFWTYSKTIPPISERKRVLLITMRTIALSILFFVLFEPIFTMVKSLIEEPRLAVLLDNSVSAGATDAKGDRKSDYKYTMTNLALQSNKVSTISYIFDSETSMIAESSFDSLDFSGQSTDISRSIRRLYSTADEDNLRAVLLVTDGAFNAGNNPVFDAERFGKPFFIIGIGDTTEPNDIAIQSIVTNEVAYIENPIPINVNFKAIGFAGERVKLVISDNNKKIAEEEVLIEQGREKYSVAIEYMPAVEGIRKITASIAPIKKEITDKNNSSSEFIRVLKNKRNIALFAGAPSPDVSFIKQALSLEKGVELKDYIQKQGAEFYNAPNQADLNASELIVLVGFPVQSTPASVLDMIARELERGKPLLFVAGQAVDYNKLKTLQNYLPFIIVSSRPQEFLAIPDIKASSLASPLLRVTGSDEDVKLWNNLPPLFRTETFVRVKPESEVVSTMKINNAPLNDPLIVTRHFQNSKTVAFLGYGLYRWKLLGYAAEQSKGRETSVDLFSVLINNSFRWLSIADQNKLVRVRTARKAYNQSDHVELVGEVYDQSYTPIDKASVVVKVSGGGEQREIVMNSLGSGRYYGTIAGLSEGDYAFSADAKFSGRNLGTDNGRFSIGEVSLEYQNLKMNAALLRTIAERTGGKFYLPNEASQAIEDIKKHKAFTTRGTSQKSEIALWSFPYLLGFALLLFALEWFIRKRAGMI